MKTSPSEIVQKLHLKRCESVKELMYGLETGKPKRSLNLPIWIRNNGNSLCFDFIREDSPTKEEILQLIKEQRLYIRDKRFEKMEVKYKF